MIITALLVCLALDAGRIVAVYTEPFQTYTKCEETRARAEAESDGKSGKTFKFRCLDLEEKAT